MRKLALTIGALAVFAAQSTRGDVIYVSQTRYIFAQTSANHGPPIREARIDAPDFGPFTQKMNRACSWNIRGGSMFANAGMAFVAVPTPPTNWPNVGAGVAASP